jgi:hypothetical protein
VDHPVYIEGGVKKWLFYILGPENLFFLKTKGGNILCGESIARVPEPGKCFPDPDSGKKLGF